MRLAEQTLPMCVLLHLVLLAGSFLIPKLNAICLTGKEPDWYEVTTVTALHILKLLVVKVISVKLVSAVTTNFLLPVYHKGKNLIIDSYFAELVHSRSMEFDDSV